ncbi:polysaccharide biosynthesis/export family protein [Novosphingobium sp. AP12]|uniref:polysaccharide biosynthesis/export family protein n=1 Tax=Novosphingobium sp. AP12 TaxID=1144305 RepID=UPI0002720F91|nr:polysaccharide biosynthesis/export family protein [Novosphingobium sp. AP12]EJL33827.1 periplasmic protein involved in polysaccharide export [Novosphingobium sp. AP12]
MSSKDHREPTLLKAPVTASLRLPGFGPGRKSFQIASALMMAGTMLAGCSSLPQNAPTSRNIVKASQSPANTLNYKIVELDAALASTPPQRNELGLVKMASFANIPAPNRSDMVLPGDILLVSVYEVGVSLFGGPAPTSAATPTAPGLPPSAAAHNIPVTVREDGNISLPYIGTLKANGFYPEELAEQIGTRLAPYSQSPQVQVAISQSVGNAAYVNGAVAKSGRYPLTSAHERLLDVIALAGGSAIDVNDAELHFTRRGESATLRLADLRAEDRANIQVLPGDRIEIRKQRKSITVFGATDRVSEIGFEAPNLSLAEALARSTGPADSRANARGVYLFRLERDSSGDVLQPVIYHIDMMNPQTYFLTQMFQMQDKDVILYSNSSSNLTQKFVGMLNMLFSPALGIRYATQ